MEARPKLTALDRARCDMEAGQYWLARQRLCSYLMSKGYDPAALAEIGTISWRMHDQFDAGRMWLTSNASGPEVDQAIEVFLKHCGRNPQAVASRLPAVVRLPRLEQYPPDVQRRLQSLGLGSAVVRPTPTRQAPRHVTLGWTFTVALLAFLLFVGISCVVGVGEIVSWVFSD